MPSSAWPATPASWSICTRPSCSRATPGCTALRAVALSTSARSTRQSRSPIFAASIVNGAVAWALLQHTPVALVLTDFMMPRLTGVELVRHIMAHPQLRHIPVVLMSAVLPEYDLDLFSLVVEKPFSIWELIDRVRTIVSP